MDRGQSLAAGKHDRQRDSRHELLQGVRLKKSWLWLLAASILLSLAVPLALGGFSQFALLHRLSWWAALVLALLAFISWGFNALRTQILMGGLGRSISFTGAVLTTMSAEFAGVATPGGVGMPATYTLLFHHLGITVGEAFGLVSAIVVTDLVFFALLMIMAIIGEIFSGAYAALLSPYLSAQPLAFSLLVWRTYNFYWFLILGAPIFLYQTGDAARNLWRRQA